MNPYKKMLYRHQRKKAHKCNIFFKDMANISKSASLTLEPHVDLNRTYVSSDNLRVGAFTYIQSGKIDKVSAIGRFCSMGSNIHLGQDPMNHPINWASTHPEFSQSYEPTTMDLVMGNDVWIGNNATIFSGLNIGDGAVVASGAIVTKNVLPYQVVAGVPAKPIRMRFTKEVVSEIGASKWWDIPLEVLRGFDFSDINFFLESVRRVKERAEYTTITIKKRVVELPRN